MFSIDIVVEGGRQLSLGIHSIFILQNLTKITSRKRFM
jgi:hypothetical protein